MRHGARHELEVALGVDVERVLDRHDIRNGTRRGKTPDLLHLSEPEDVDRSVLHVRDRQVLAVGMYVTGRSWRLAWTEDSSKSATSPPSGSRENAL